MSGLRVGLMKEGFDDSEHDVVDTVKSAAYSLKQLGVTVEEFSFPELNDCQFSIVTQAVRIYSVTCTEWVRKESFCIAGCNFVSYALI